MPLQQRSNADNRRQGTLESPTVTLRRNSDVNTTPFGQKGDAFASNNRLQTRNARGLSSDILFSLVPARMAHGHHSQPKHRET